MHYPSPSSPVLGAILPAIAGRAAVARGDAGGERLADARERFEEIARWTIESEWPELSMRLTPADRAAFREYYRALLESRGTSRTRRYLRGLWDGEPGWAARWIAARAGRGAGTDGAPRVLDAGSGFATFAMMFAAIGAEVVAMDLREDRARVAEARLDGFRAHTRRSLPLTLRRASVTAPLDGPFDLIWTYNALSHIEPPADFLARARESLAPDGVLVLADINGANPAHRRRLAGLRRDVRKPWIDDQGASHHYAVERTYTPAGLRQLIEHTGLRVVHHELYYLSGARLPEVLADGLLRPLQRCIRLGSLVARRQLLVAARADVDPVPPGRSTWNS